MTDPTRPTRPDTPAEIDEELHHHIEGRIEEYRAQGMSLDEARALAHEKFGDLRRVAADCRSEGPASPSSRRATGPLAGLGHDITWTLRALRRHPAYTAAVLATLVIAIGATSSVFTVVNGVLLEPLPHPNADELALVYELDQRPGFIGNRNVVAPANYADWAEQNRVFETFAAFNIYPMTLRTDGDPLRATVGLVTEDFFTVLGADVQIGRPFSPEENQAGQDNVVVLSHAFWQRQFGGDPDVLERSVSVGSTTAPIVGVMSPGFNFLDRPVDVWTPLALDQDALQNRRSHYLRTIGRLLPGMTMADAQRDLDRVVDGLRQEYPSFLSGWGVSVVSMTDEVVGSIRPALVLLLGAVGLVLLIAVVNVANLSLARAIVERQQLALRSAVGASGGQLIRQRLTESLVLAFTGGILGVALAVVATNLLLGFAPETLPRTSEIGVDGRVLGFALLVSLAAGVLFGIIPAVQAGRTDAAAYLRGGSRDTGDRSQQQMRAGFVVGQLALSLILLISAGLTATGFTKLIRVDPGFAASNVTSFDFAFPAPAYPTAGDKGALYDRVITELESAAEIEQAGLTWFLPFDNTEWTWSVQIDGQPEREEGEKRDYAFHIVSPGYFQAMGIRLIEGRQFTESDRAETPLVVMVNEAFVGRFFTDGDEPIGQRVRLLSGELADDRWMEIVGVVEDVHHYALDEAPLPAYFTPHAQMPWDWVGSEMSVVTRASRPSAELGPVIRNSMRGIEPMALVTDMHTMRQRIARSVDRPRFAMLLLLAFAGVALVLALIGTYGVISYTVGQRSRELGVRLALGASPTSIMRGVLLGGAKIAGVGIVAGVLGALFFTRLQASLLFGIESFDLTIYAGVAALLASVAILASYVPARRAARVNPVEVLRSD